MTRAPSNCQDEPVYALIAPDKFKGTYSAIEIAAVLANILNEHGINADIVPMADGGEGTLDVLGSAGFEQIEISASDAFGEPHDCRYALLGNHAIIELASTCGMASVQDNTRTNNQSPWSAGTFGLGEAANWALGVINPHDPQFPKEPNPDDPPTITVAVGGSASVDGGLGFLQALGFQVTDEAGNQVPPNANGLVVAHNITPPSWLDELKETKWRVLTDVENPALGPQGAAAIFGPQKGFTETDCVALEAALTNWIALLANATNKDANHIANTPGAGAAGAITAALIAAFDAEVVPGAAAIADAIEIDQHLEGCELAIIGEGRLDDQTPHGKAPSEIAKRARAAGKPIFAFVGQDAASEATKQQLGITATVSLEEHGQNILAAGTELAMRIMNSK